MHKLCRIRHAFSRDRMLALIAFGFLSWQIAGIVHALDLDAHEPGTSCHLCQAHDRSGSAPPATVTTILAEAEHERATSVPAVALHDASRSLPRVRGPPSR